MNEKCEHNYWEVTKVNQLKLKDSDYILNRIEVSYRCIKMSCFKITTETKFIEGPSDDAIWKKDNITKSMNQSWEKQNGG